MYHASYTFLKCSISNTLLLIVKVWDRLPHLKAVVQYIGEVGEKRPNVYSVSMLLCILLCVVTLCRCANCQFVIPNGQ